MNDPSAGRFPPAPGWWLASDGNWYPPQARPGGPPPAAGENPPLPGAAIAGVPPGQPGWYGPPPPTSSTGRTVAIVLGVAAAAFVGIAVVSILAITFLGTSSTSKFSSVGTAINNGSGGVNTDAVDGYCDVDRFLQDPDC